MEFRQYIHAPASVLLRDHDVTVQLLLPDEEPHLPMLELIYAVVGQAHAEGRLRMLPVDGYRAEDSYTVYAATIPAREMMGDRLEYRFCKDGEESAAYSVMLCHADVLPPLVVTETSLWPCVYPYLEFKNLTDRAIDLADYELLMRRSDGVLCRNALADRAGESILPPGGLAAVNFVKAPFATEESREAAKTAAFENLGGRYPMIAQELASPELSFYFATIAVPKKADGTPYEESKFEFQRSQYGATIYIVPRGGTVEDAVYAVPHRFDDERHDANCRLATIFQPTLEAPREGQIIDARAVPTPGFPDARQTGFDMGDGTVPVILPVSPTTRASLSGGDLPIRFAVIGGSEIGHAQVLVSVGGDFLSHIAYQNNDGLFEHIVPFEELAHMSEPLRYYIKVQGGLYAASLGSEKEPMTVALIDDRGPQIVFADPAPYRVLENEHFPQITVAYHDISGVNMRISSLCLDGINVSDKADWQKDRVTYRPTASLAFGTHTIEITLRDARGNRTYEKWDFAIGDGKELSLYCGQVHSHTDESDGKGTPAEAFEYARNVTHMDYFAVTEHSGCYDHPTYKRQIKLANRLNDPGKLATLYGFEMTWHQVNGFFGHINFLNSEWACHATYANDLDAFNKGVAEHPEGIAMFNHPGDTWGNGDDFRDFSANVKETYALYEMNGARHHPSYALALSRGWRVSPLLNEDNHHADWGDSGGMGYVLAPALTRENILDAMRRRRTYSTTDRTMQIRYRVNGEWLGAVLHNPEKLDVEVEVITESERGIGRLELLTEDSIVVATVEAGALSEFRWHVELNPDFDYYYLRITNGPHHTVTAPVFIEGRNQLNIKRMGYGISEDAEHPHVVTATVKNEGDKAISDIAVDFYLTGPDGFVLRQLAPFEEVHVGKLQPGEVRTVSRRFPDVVGCHRVTAVVSGMAGKQRYVDTAYVLISPVTITKVMPLTSAVEKDGVAVKNPYAYVEIYNHTQKPIELKDYSLGVWNGTGQKSIPADARVLSLAGLHVPPESTLTVWVKGANNPLTVADFNAHYGTQLLEGEDLFVTDQLVLPTNNEARKIDVRRAGEILTRAKLGYYCTHDTDVVADRALCYAITPSDVVTSKFIKLGEGESVPAPGKLLPAQVPRILSGLCRKREMIEAEKSATKKEVFTRLTKASLVPFRTAAFVANAVSAFKGFFDTKE